MKNILCAIMSLLLFVACTTTEESPSSVPNGGNESVTPSITLEHNYLNFDEHADVQTISFSSTMDWTAELINDRADGWCSISATSGTAGSKDIDVTVTENTSTDDRTASVIIKSGAISKTVRISQKQRDALTVTSSTFEIEGTSGKIYIEVKANVDFEYTINGSAAEWITPIETRAMKTTTLGFNIAENKTMQRREGTITIHSGDLSETVTVYQKDHGDAILLSHNEYVVSDTGEDIAVEVTSNVDVEIEMPDVDWITRNTSRAVSTNTYYFTIAENTTYDQREAYITFKNTEKKISERVKVSQVQKDAIVLAAEQYNVTSEGEQITIELGHNVDFDFEIVGDWITHVETRALQTNYLVFEVASNASYDSREGSVIFTANNGSLTQVAKIFQAQRDAIIISDNDIVVSDASQQISFDVETNIDFSVINPDVDWLHPVVTRGLTTHTLTYTVDENTTYDSREAQIVVKNNATNITQTVTVTQAQKDAIVLAKSEYEIELEGGALDFDIQTNVEVSVSISEDAQSWITRVQTRGLETRTLYFDIAPYDGDATREGTITISGGNAMQTINICQFSWQTLEDNKIYYTSSDGQIVEPYSATSWGDNTTIISNTYENGQGVIVFSRNLTEIGSWAFQDNGNKFTSITLPKTLKKIGYQAFLSCSQLTEIEIPNSVTSIGTHAFASCTALTEVTLGENLETIGDTAFVGCTALTSITIPDKVKSIGYESFKSCANLTEVTLGSGLETIGENAFLYCGELESITIPDSVTSIGSSAFQDCYALASVTFGRGLETIGDSAFAVCNSLTNITIPDNVKWLGNNAFNSCENLTKVNIGDGVETIGDNSFDGCLKLAEITLGESVETIGWGAFRDCDALTSITIPNSVKTIDGYAFNGCSNLAEINIGTGVETIGEGAFQSCEALTSLNIPGNVKTINNYAFNNCYNLAEITLNEGLETIGSNAFGWCYALKSITIPQSVVKITGNPVASCNGIEAFYGKFASEDNSTLIINNEIVAIANHNDLTSYTIPNGITKIANSAFANWYNLQSITIPDSVTEIGNYAFESCGNLQTINIPESVTSIGADAFLGCGNLQTINIPEGITTIKSNTFGSCSNLKEITLPNSLTKIEDWAFIWSGLTEITIPDSVTEIGNGAFVGCGNLTSFSGKFASADNRCLIINDELVAFTSAGLTEYTFPNGITTIKTYSCAHLANEQLTTITIPNSVTMIENSAFWDANYITEITISENITNIGSDAFGECDKLSKVYVKATTPPHLDWYVFNNTDENLTIYVPRESVDAYKTEASWSGYDYAHLIVGYDF